MPENSLMGRVVLIIVVLLGIVAMLAGMWRTFEKARQPGWAALVPFYNVFLMTRVGRVSGWWALIACIPYIGLAGQVAMSLGIARSFGRGAAFGIGLLFLPYVFYPILGFGDARHLAVDEPRRLEEVFS